MTPFRLPPPVAATPGAKPSANPSTAATPAALAPPTPRQLAAEAAMSAVAERFAAGLAEGLRPSLPCWAGHAWHGIALLFFNRGDVPPGMQVVAVQGPAPFDQCSAEPDGLARVWILIRDRDFGARYIDFVFRAAEPRSAGRRAAPMFAAELLRTPLPTPWHAGWVAVVPTEAYRLYADISYFAAELPAAALVGGP